MNHAEIVGFYTRIVGLDPDTPERIKKRFSEMLVEMCLESCCSQRHSHKNDEFCLESLMKFGELSNVMLDCDVLVSYDPNVNITNFVVGVTAERVIELLKDEPDAHIGYATDYK